MLFAMGCGRVFEASWRHLWDAGEARRAARGNRIYSGHEYTLANARFARTVHPQLAAGRPRRRFETQRAAAKGPSPDDRARARDQSFPAGGGPAGPSRSAWRADPAESSPKCAKGKMGFRCDDLNTALWRREFASWGWSRIPKAASIARPSAMRAQDEERPRRFGERCLLAARRGRGLRLASRRRLKRSGVYFTPARSSPSISRRPATPPSAIFWGPR